MSKKRRTLGSFEFRQLGNDHPIQILSSVVNVKSATHQFTLISGLGFCAPIQFGLQKYCWNRQFLALYPAFLGKHFFRRPQCKGT